MEEEVEGAGDGLAAVDRVRGHLADDGSVAHSRVSLKLGFKIED